MRRLLFLLCAFALPFGAVHARTAPSGGEVKNLIYMIGDGTGLAQVSLLMIERGYEPVAFDRAQNVALVSTYSANNRVTDSAAAGTALATGRKTDNGMLGQTPDGAPVESMIARAVRGGRPTGEVVTSTLQHATPAAFYAHAADRDDDRTITEWLVRSGVDVLFGGGGGSFSDEQLAVLRGKGYRIVRDPDQLDAVSSGKVLGLFADGHLASARKGRGDYLPRATQKALEILDADARETGRGFLLMVEGSQIDWAGHDNDAELLLAEMTDFDRAVSAAMDFADDHPGTLVVVTADHETGGLSIPSNEEDFHLSDSGVQYDFSTGGHSGTLVPVYLYGTGAERINGILDNTELAQRLMQLLGLE